MTLVAHPFAAKPWSNHRYSNENLRLFRAEDPEIACPAWMITILNGVKKVLCMPTWIFRSHVACFLIGKGLATKIGHAMDLDVIEGALRLG